MLAYAFFWCADHNHGIALHARLPWMVLSEIVPLSKQVETKHCFGHAFSNGFGPLRQQARVGRLLIFPG
jgi:hypothetical protein